MGKIVPEARSKQRSANYGKQYNRLLCHSNPFFGVDCLVALVVPVAAALAPGYSCALWMVWRAVVDWGPG